MNASASAARPGSKVQARILAREEGHGPTSAGPPSCRSSGEHGWGADGPLHGSPVVREPGTVTIRRTPGRVGFLGTIDYF